MEKIIPNESVEGEKKKRERIMSYEILFCNLLR